MCSGTGRSQQFVMFSVSMMTCAELLQTVLADEENSRTVPHWRQTNMENERQWVGCRANAALQQKWYHWKNIAVEKKCKMWKTKAWNNDLWKVWYQLWFLKNLLRCCTHTLLHTVNLHVFPLCAVCWIIITSFYFELFEFELFKVQILAYAKEVMFSLAVCLLLKSS